MTPHPTTIPADLFGDALLRDWCGPAQAAHEPPVGRWLDAVVLHLESTRVILTNPIHGDAPYQRLISEVRLPLARPECRANVLRVLARGERNTLGSCCDDPGHDWLRKPAPTYHLVTPDEGGTLPAEHAQRSAALLAHHAVDVARGGKGIVGVLGGWVENAAPHLAGTWRRKSLTGSDACSEVWHREWFLRASNIDCLAHGRHDSSDAGKAAADTAALARGFALLDGDVLRMGSEWREG
jgi:hypothetical protein